MTAYKLDELARRAGVSARTVRYYVQRGLVPAPAFKGPDTAYGEEQLAALLAVKRLQEEFWPLEAIATAIAGRSIAELHRIGDGTLVPRKPAPHDDEAHVSPPAPASKRRAPQGATARDPHPAPLPRARGERVELGQGLALWIDETAGEAERALAVEIERLARAMTTKREERR